MKTSTETKKQVAHDNSNDAIKNLQPLNAEQQDAVNATDGWIRVIAGPGTGKTTVLTRRLFNLVHNHNVDPQSIMSITFTNKAAFEMRERIIPLLDYGNTNIYTFHGFCHMLLKKHGSLFRYDNFMIMTRDDQLRSIKDIKSKIDDPSVNFYSNDDILNHISEWKHANTDYASKRIKQRRDKFKPNYALSYKDIVQTIIFKYIEQQHFNLAVDFDDLLHFGLHILTSYKDVSDYYQDKFKYIQVDEFQDVCGIQYELVRILQSKHHNLFVVGDPDQNIYSWRNADIVYINNFDLHKDKIKTFILTKNYRSTPEIVEAAQALIQNNKDRIDKPLYAVKPSGSKIIYAACRNNHDEAAFISETIERLKREKHAKYHDIAILYRSSYQTRVIEHSLIEKSIPYVIVKGTSFYERMEIQDALALLRLVVYGDDYSLLRVITKLTHKLGPARINALKEYAYQNKVLLFDALKACLKDSYFKDVDAKMLIDAVDDVRVFMKEMTTSQILSDILRQSGYEDYILKLKNSDRFDNLAELKRSIITYEEEIGKRLDPNDYLSEIAIYSSLVEKHQPNCVKLMTQHAAKGLEFRFVIIAGMNEGIFPSGKISSEQELEEECRLAYVSFTRAEEELILTSSARGFENKHLQPSRFIEAIPERLLIKKTRDHSTNSSHFAKFLYNKNK